MLIAKETASKLSEEAEDELFDIDRSLTNFKDKEKRGEKLTEQDKKDINILRDDSEILKKKINNYKKEKEELEEQLKFSLRNQKLIFSLQDIEEKIFSDKVKLKDYIKINDMISKIEDNYYSIIIKKLRVDSELYKNLNENTKHITIPTIKNEAKKLFERELTYISINTLKEWILNAAEYLDVVEVFRVIKLVITGVYTKTPIEEKRLKEKIRVLILSSDPDNLPSLESSEEIRLIMNHLSYNAFFEVFIDLAVRIKDIVNALVKYKPNIIHFTGHGSIRGTLVFRDEKGLNAEIQPKQLSEMLKLIANDLQCVFLNACYSDLTAKEIAKHVDCVIGTSQATDLEASAYFAEGFYIGLINGLSVEESFKAGKMHSRLFLEEERYTDIVKPYLIIGKKNPADIYFVQK